MPRFTTKDGIIDGRSSHPLYRTLQGMKRRCYRKNDKGYKDYGGRGIKICDRWLLDFWAFVADMGEKPSSHHSIGRINNNLGYEPSNCRWELPIQQANNTRRRFREISEQELLKYESKLSETKSDAEIKKMIRRMIAADIKSGRVVVPASYQRRYRAR